MTGTPLWTGGDDAVETFRFRGHDVRVRDRVRVESQDPALIAVLAKLTALEHTVEVSRSNLATVMGVED